MKASMINLFKSVVALGFPLQFFQPQEYTTGNMNEFSLKILLQLWIFGTFT